MTVAETLSARLWCRHGRSHVAQSVRISGVMDQARPLCHLAEVTVGIVQILDGRDVGAKRQGPRRLKPCLIAENAGGNCNVVLFVEDFVQRPVLRAPVLGANIAQNFTRVGVPNFFANATRGVAMRGHDLACHIKFAARKDFAAVQSQSEEKQRLSRTRNVTFVASVGRFSIPMVSTFK